MASKVGPDGRETGAAIVYSDVRSKRGGAWADARHDTFMFHGRTEKIDIQHQTSFGQTM